ncbi:MAG: hypothetical protein H0W72_11465 [Planctomycetes bacterium]|nr:hypothetical protein [Planctomycetota bacterium]
MHEIAIILLACAGIGYCVAAALRWRSLRAEAAPVAMWPLGLALVLHSASVVISVVDGRFPDFTFAVLGVWAAIASLVFLARFLTVPSKWLLALPVGGMALLVVAGALAGRVPAPEGGGGRAIITVHLLFMAAHLAAAVLSGASAILYLLAVRQLKAASAGAFQLPNLPQLDHLFERSLVAATALLIGGLATGGAAIQYRDGFSLLHPTALLALVTMAVLIAALALRLADRLGRRGTACAAIGVLALNAASVFSVLVDQHG